jgi:ribonucleoside-diphosphate reductase alpha chain
MLDFCGDPNKFDIEISKRYKAGEIALCNLSSINLVEWAKLDDTGKNNLVSTVVRMLDNTVDLAVYPVKEGEVSNKQWRYLGIGVLNYANYLASIGISIDTQEALEETSRLFDDLSYRIISASCDLAIEKGAFPKFRATKWAKGDLPIKNANPIAMSLTKYQPDMDKWGELSERIVMHGLRNAQLMAIAPTATSGKALNATESIEPIQDFLYKEEGTITIPCLVPNFRKNNKYYVKAFDCDQTKLIELAAIRQMYLDQAQSINLYIRRPDSLLELTKLHLSAFKMGVKTLYYVKQLKGDAEETCESCT